MTPKCTSWFGHWFEARYSTIPPSIQSLADSGLASVSPTLIKSLSQKTYECDVCVRCGHVVTKPKP